MTRYVVDDGCCPHGKLHTCPPTKPAQTPDVDRLARALFEAELDVERLLTAFHSTFCSQHGHPVEYDRPIIEKVAAEYRSLGVES